MKEVIFAKNGPKPGGCYSQAIKAGNTLYVSGQIAVDPVSGKLVGAGRIGGQTVRIIKNLQIILAKVGASLDNIVKTTVFIDDINKFSEFNEVYSKYFSKNPPARSTIEVGKFMEGICIEIEAIAIL